ncbi:MAG: ABC transporter ATP-binding protein [Planctomycetota bacterium]
MSSVPVSFRDSRSSGPKQREITESAKIGDANVDRGTSTNWEQAVATGEIKPRRREMSTTTAKVEVKSALPLRVVDNCILQAKQLHKTYRKDNHAVPVLNGCDFHANAGKMTAILGQSGSGKSTLLHLLGTLDAPDEGEIYFDGERIDNLSRRERDRFRNAKLGMIFQFYHLLPEITAFQNVLLPMMIRQGVWQYIKDRKAIQDKAKQLLVRVGLEHRLHHKPRELSGGEMQRAAIARALVAEPELLLADEPTGNLDRKTGVQILDLLRELNDETGLTIVMVTHDERIANDCDATIRLADGRIES